MDLCAFKQQATQAAHKKAIESVLDELARTIDDAMQALHTSSAFVRLSSRRYVR
jgi:molecular chaperone GrpE (heat shock protein)